VEGVNVGGFLLGYLSLFVLALAVLMALGFLVAGLTQAARILYANGLLVAALIGAFATLSFLSREFHPEGNVAAIGLTALSLSLVGGGPFIAALRGTRAYAAVVACAVGSLLLLASPVLGGDAVGRIPGVTRLLGAIGFVPLAAAALLLAAAGIALAILLPVRPRQECRKGVGLV
jgi:hypothetical protein